MVRIELQAAQMLTFGGKDFQYFRVARFDFHRARAPDEGRDRITITTTKGDPAPIPPESPGGVVARRREGTVAARVGLLPVPAADRVSWRGDLRTQGARVGDYTGR